MEKQIINIRGTQNYGKSTMIGMIYSALLENPKCHKKHLFFDSGNKNKASVEVSKNSLSHNENGDINDFRTILNYKNKKITIVSAGDDVALLKTLLLDFEKGDSAVFICATRTKNQEDSSFKLLRRDFNFLPQEEFWSLYAKDVKDRYTIKEKTVKEVLDFIDTHIG